ncbi:MAG: PAS domain S-box protein, partial [Candidatus Marinimicrobia bacterium]|nr:PAS domain S-box protein [Candidatus Neomarinimicrobiota bacterium]
MLEHQENLFSSIIETTPDAVISIDERGRILFWNRAAERMFGYSAKDMIQKDLKQLMPKRYWGSHNEAIRNLSGNGQSRQLGNTRELVGLRRDGSEFPLELSLSSWTGEGKVQYTGIIRDITERKRAERALKLSESRAIALLEAIPDMMFRVNSQGVFLDYQADKSELYAKLEETIIGKNNRDISPPEFADLVDQKIKLALDSGEMQTFEYQLPLPRQGMRDYEARIVKSSEEEVIAIVRDITERKRADKDLQYKAAALERSNRELQQFARAISHDLQEPLRTISSFVQLLADRYKEQLDAKADIYIGHIVDGAHRMHEQIRGILALSKVNSDTNDLGATKCEDILEDVRAGLKVYIKEKNAKITHDPLPTVRANSAQMAQLFQNLIENAIKFRGEKP